MPINAAQKRVLEEVVNALLTATSTRGKRQLSAMFLELVDRTDWPQYYEIIPEPRCLNNIKAGIEKGRYKDATDVYTDLSLVFWNALFYNEPNSQIAIDAEMLKIMLEAEWKKHPSLPTPRSSPPPSSAQKVHKTAEIPSPFSIPTPPPKTETVSPVAPLPVPIVPARTATPTQPIASTPAASTSYAHTKPVHTQLQVVPPQFTPDMDVDVMSPDSEGQGDDITMQERDPQSEEIARQLERGLPRWPGFGEQGWIEDLQLDHLIDIVQSIKSHKDIIGNRLATALESVPEDAVIPNLSTSIPISLKSIEARIRSKDYSSAKEFDLDMAHLFGRARRWHDPGTEAYGRVLLLQRLYQAITSPNTPPGPPHLSSTNFAALRAGPGNVKPVHGADSEGVPSVTTHRVLTKDRVFVNEVHYKGWSIKLADWLHLSNPDDPSRPIIGQVFRCWTSDEFSKKGQLGVTVSWYYRPEQTFHPASRQFWEGEVFKTSHFADHPVEDIIEKIACQFTARHIRGRPRPPFWYVGWPLYVCDSRYNDRERIFVKIKNWNSCVPEEVRKSDEFMPIYPFERMVFPARVPSPFLSRGGGKSAVKNPGGLVHIAEGVTVAEGDAAAKKSRKDVGSSKAQASIPTSTITQMPGYQATGYGQQLQQVVQRPEGSDRSVITAAGGLAAIGGSAQVEKLPPETAKHFDRDPETNQVLWFAAPPVDVPRPRPVKHSLEYLHFLAKKRKQEIEDKNNVDVGQRTLDRVKRSRISVPPTATETMRAIAKEMLMNLDVEPEPKS